MQFADDTSLFLQDEDSLVRALQLIDRFKKISGLGLNLHKSQGIIVGDLELHTDLAKTIPWGDSFQILGVTFDVREYENKDFILNFGPAIAKMKKICESWSVHKLSLKDKSVILNTLVLPIISAPCFQHQVQFSGRLIVLSPFFGRARHQKSVE